MQRQVASSCLRNLIPLVCRNLIAILKQSFCYRYKKNLKHFYIIHPTFWTKVSNKNIVINC